ncbi:hypothetical protein Tco_0335329 [Tanacetum coccineum]
MNEIQKLKIRFQRSEARALAIMSQTREQLETLKSTEETLRMEKMKAVEAYESLSLELEKSKPDLLENISNPEQLETLKSPRRQTHDGKT